MTAASLLHSHGRRTGLRAVDPRRDMGAIGELIELAFGAHLDRVGRRMLRLMRRLGRLGWLGWLLSWYLLPPAARPLGFVWEADGRLVGNASLLTVSGHPGRWVLVNVAVHPAYRRRGIARALVQASLDWVRQRQGRLLLLQVDSDNGGAVDLYASLGFETLATRTTWTCRAGDLVEPPWDVGHARRRKPEEWRAQWLLARRLYPEGLLWPYPLSSSLFQRRGWSRSRHWIYPEDDRLVASLSALWWAEQACWRLVLLVDPRAKGQIERPLLALAASDLHKFGGSLVLEAEQGELEQVLGELGFSSVRTLTWMAMELERAGAPAAGDPQGDPP